MSDLIVYTSQESVLPQGTTDNQLIEIWLHGMALSTQEEYRRDIRQFRVFTTIPIQLLKLPELQAYLDELLSLEISGATVTRRINALKSLLSFAQETGYTRFNVGAMVRPPKYKKTLAERILSEEQVFTMLAREQNPRNHALLRLMYAAGLRVSEVTALCWCDIVERGKTGQVTVFGKGSKTRTILLKEGTYQEVIRLREDSKQDGPVFRSRGGGHSRGGGKLDPSQVLRIVSAAAKRAGIQGHVSPHWLRHAHASHALENGATIALVKDTLGHESIVTTSGYTHARPGESSTMYIKL